MWYSLLKAYIYDYVSGCVNCINEQIVRQQTHRPLARTVKWEDIVNSQNVVFSIKKKKKKKSKPSITIYMISHCFISKLELKISIICDISPEWLIPNSVQTQVIIMSVVTGCNCYIMYLFMYEFSFLMVGYFVLSTNITCLYYV